MTTKHTTTTKKHDTDAPPAIERKAEAKPVEPAKPATPPTEAAAHDILALVERLNKVQHKTYSVGVANAMKALTEAHGHLGTVGK